MASYPQIGTCKAHLLNLNCLLWMKWGKNPKTGGKTHRFPELTLWEKKLIPKRIRISKLKEVETTLLVELRCKAVNVEGTKSPHQESHVLKIQIIIRKIKISGSNISKLNPRIISWYAADPDFEIQYFPAQENLEYLRVQLNILVTNQQDPLTIHVICKMNQMWSSGLE